jgi:hypothetical protein
MTFSRFEWPEPPYQVTMANFHAIHGGQFRPWIVPASTLDVRLAVEIIETLRADGYDFKKGPGGRWMVVNDGKLKFCSDERLRSAIEDKIIFVAEVDGVIRIGVRLRDDYLAGVLDVWRLETNLRTSRRIKK